uniref:NADH-ubiquinone oxidoreductase chain 4 n=1 Tax=Mesargus serrata TaxID=2901391 RepID=A0A8K1TF55_9HEMI|nr:NADH dehydrogenase subunit 4 [Mesargus serrata]
MELIFFIIFLIPLFFFNYWILFQFNFLLFFYLFMFKEKNNFYSCLSYLFGVDYYSYWLILLTIFIFNMIFMAFLYFRNTIFYYMLVLNSMFLLISLILFFSTINLMVLYMFFEFSLVPLIIFIFGWGYQPERLVSSIYLFLYTLIASLPLFMLIMKLYFYSMTLFVDLILYFNLSFMLFVFLVLAFLVKLPMYMLHFWLPKAHVQAPVYGSMILAGILLKMGGYGLIRIFNMFDFLFYYYSYFIYSFSLWGSLLVSLICLMQSDFKSMVAYSSIVHMGLFILGFLTMTLYGFLGSYLMMLAHGLCSSGLFYLVNIYYNRLFSRSFYLIKGMIMFMPSLSLIFFMYCALNMGCPPSLNFFSELMIFISSVSYFDVSILYLLLISFFSACFCFYMFSYTQHGSYSSLYSFSMVYCSEYLVLFVHLIPMLMLIFNMEVFI